MNELEQWLADVKAFNESVREFDVNADAIIDRHFTLENSGKALGLRTKKIRAMLARVKLKVEMPEETGK